MSSSKDPLSLADLDPDVISAKIDARDKKTGKAPSELELQKEARLAEKERRLNVGGTSKSSKTYAPEAPSIAPNPTPKVDRTALLDKITAYRERFVQVKKRNNVSAKSSDEELIDELHYIEMQLGNGGSKGNLSSTLLWGGMIGIEKFTRDYWNPLGLQLDGLGTVAQQNMHEFQPILDELMIKHSAGTYTSPEWRLALMIGASVMTVNAANQNPQIARAVKSMNMAVNAPAGSADL